MCREVDKSHESAQSKAHEPCVVHHISRQSCEATNRNVIEAQRDPEVSCPWTAKPFPTDSGVDDELVQRFFQSADGLFAPFRIFWPWER